MWTRWISWIAGIALVLQVTRSVLAAETNSADTGSAVEAGRAAEVELLRRQVEHLTEALVRARVEADTLRARADRKEFEDARAAMAGAGADEDVTPAEMWLVDVNTELGMVVLNAGTRQGIRPGMQFAVVRGGKKIAQVRVIETREHIAGAVIQSRGLWSQPRVKDRAVMAAGSAE